MYTRGSRLLCEALYKVLNRASDLHHKVCKLVDNNDDSGKSLAKRGVCLYHFVIRLNVTYLSFSDKLVSAIHFFKCPGESARGMLGVCNYGNKKVGNSVILTEFNHLWIHQNELHLIRSCLVEHA